MSATKKKRSGAGSLIELVVIVATALGLALGIQAFLVKPYRIPSESMEPTLDVGQRVLVNRIGSRFTDPEVGDVVVFHPPRGADTNECGAPKPQDQACALPTQERSNVNFIKRVVGVPGDEVSYRNQQLYLNGKPVAEEPMVDFFNEENTRFEKQYREQLGTTSHRILVDPSRPSAYLPGNDNFPFRENCRYSAEGVTCKVPPGHYFMMGDNRDNSQDSRYWGFVPDENIVGKAFFVWMNFGDLRRIGSFE